MLAHERAAAARPISCRRCRRSCSTVVGRYVEISEDMIRVNVGKSGDTSLLEINVEIDGAKPKPGGGAALSAAV